MTQVVLERNHVVVNQDDAMADFLPRSPLRHVAKPSQLTATDGSVLSKKGFLSEDARVETDDHGVGLWQGLLPGPTGFKVEMRLRRIFLPPFAFGVARRARPRTARDRKQKQVVISRYDEKAPALVPARERGVDELPTRSIVRAVASDDYGIDMLLGEHVCGKEEPEIDVSRGTLEQFRKGGMARNICG
jgi:hypothetical protein